MSDSRPAFPGSLHIRRGAESDADRLAAFAARCFVDTYGADNRPEDMQAHLASSYGPEQQARELCDPDVVTLLACRGDMLLGYAQVRRGPAPPCVRQDHPVELHRFYVDRPAHGTGLAHQLMDAARAAGVALGGRQLWLGVWERNPRAIAFYSKERFVDEGSTVFCVGPDRQTDRVMVADLTDTSEG